jgi:thiol-disulfide isomerase/thioredoxin
MAADTEPTTDLTAETATDVTPDTESKPQDDTPGMDSNDVGSATDDSAAQPDVPLAVLPGFESWGSQQCPPDNGESGFAVGASLGELPVQDCDTGEPRSLTEACGAAATWLFVAHSHCPTCVATAQYTAKVAADYAERNVAVVHIVHIDSGTTCPAWRKKYGLEGLPNVRVYADKSADAWAALKVSNSTAIHAFASGERVITYKAHGLSSSQVGKQLDAALAK